MNPVRIGTLGAARITPLALARPARTVPEVEVVAVAARDPRRAERFAAKHKIPNVYDTYEDLLADPNVDAVYNPLPNGLHGRWTLAALDAGKHVLCEKPFTANAEEAELVSAAARESGLVVMEAFHYRYHPLIERVLEIATGGELGRLRRVETRMCIPLPMRGDIRYQLDLAGGALMDVGCYAIHQLRTISAAEPRVTSAQVHCVKPGVDRWARADLDLGDGCTGAIECALWSRRLFSIRTRVEGELGELTVTNLTVPQYFHRLVVRTREPSSGSPTRRREKVRGETTYWYQLKAFAAAVREGAPFPTTTADAVLNMRVIDAVYRAAGLEPRRPST